MGITDTLGHFSVSMTLGLLDSLASGVTIIEAFRLMEAPERLFCHPNSNSLGPILICCCVRQKDPSLDTIPGFGTLDSYNLAVEWKSRDRHPCVQY